MLWLPPLRRKPPIGRPIVRYSWLMIALAGLSANALLVSSLTDVDVGLPPPPTVQEISPLAQTTHILDRNGRRIAALHGEENRVIVPLDEIPDHVRDAVLAIEDASFYEHGGIDLSAVARAFAANLNQGKVVQGASTITQQYVRNAFDEIGRERTLGRKIEEARTALEVERTLSKEEILQRYLNTVYFGRGAYGVEAAAQTYFGRSIRDVSIAQAGALAGLIHAPAIYFRDPQLLRERRNLVLKRMALLRWIDQDEHYESRRSRLDLRPPSADREVRAAFFVEHVRRLLKTPEERGGFGLTDDQILRGGLTVHTTLDLDMQRSAERAVRAVLYQRNDPEAALVAMTTTGEIRAMVGGRHFRSLERARGFNYATQLGGQGGGRQSGSAFKTFTLATYLAQGGDPLRRYSAPSRVTVDECGPEDDPWRPSNYGDNSYGSLTVAEATELSVNTVYAQVVEDVGPRAVMRMAKRLGIGSPLEPVCSITLGVHGVTPLEMARAYSTFPTRGRRPEVVAVTKVVGPDGEVLAEREPSLTRVLDARVADRVNAILQRVMERGTGTPANIPRPSAGKTGTTDHRRDVWFVGYTPNPGLTAAVWMGRPPNEDGRVPPMYTLRGQPVTGGGFPGQIWRLFMSEALDGEEVREFRSVSLNDGNRSSSTRSSSSSSRSRGDRSDEPSTPSDENRGNGDRGRSRSSNDGDD